jgi:hypothetical protein
LGYEVLDGARGVLAQVQLLHVELESVPCIGAGQHLAPEVVSMLESAGFDEIAADQPRSSAQFNAVFLRRGQDASTMRHVRRALALGVVRRRCVSLAARASPRLMRRLQTWRAARSISA